MDDQLTINDLPVECVEEILKWITDRIDRIYARFVCKMWCALIDRDCSAECYQIEYPFYQPSAKYNRRYKNNVKFSEMFSPLLNSQRKKTSFHIEHVINFKGSEQFWRTKGAGIISLYFGIHCSNIPLKEIIEQCSVLKSLTIDLNDGKEQELPNMLENCVIHGKSNFSVRSLYFNYSQYSFGNDVDVNYVTNIARLVGRVFLGVQNVFFENVIFDGAIRLNWANKMNSLSTAFKNLKFVITLLDFCEENTIVFNPLGNVPVKMTSLMIDKIKNNDISAHLSHYPGGHNYLKRLNLNLDRTFYRLDDVLVFITMCPSLKSIRISVFVESFLLTNPLSKNNIEDISLYGIVSNDELPFTINDAFLQSFESLKSFECGELFFSDYVKLLRRLPNIEKLKVHNGVIDVNPPDEVRMISHGKLLKLEMPRLFLLQTIVKYDFSNLKKLSLQGNKFERKLNLLARDMDKQLKRMNCPKLERIFIQFDVKKFGTNQRKFTNWMQNIVSLFPRLAEFFFPDKVDINIRCRNSRDMAEADQIMKTVFEKSNYRRLRIIGSIEYMHRLNVLSPSHIKHRCRYGQSVFSIV